MSNVVNSNQFTYSDNQFVIERSILNHLIGFANSHKTIFIQSNKTGEIVEFELTNTKTSLCNEVVSDLYYPKRKYVEKNVKLANVSLIVFNT